MAPRLFALVKWTGGADDKKYTAGVPVEWIKGFDYNKFRSSNYDPTESEVIEWHEGKEPPGGWPVFDGYVIEVSNRICLLESKLKALDGIMSPTKFLTSQDGEASNESLSGNKGKMAEKSSKSQKKISDKNISSMENSQQTNDENNCATSKNQNTQSVGGINKAGTKRQQKNDDATIQQQLSKTRKIAPSYNSARDLPGCSGTAANKKKAFDEIMTDDAESSENEGTISTKMSGITRLDRKKYNARLSEATAKGDDPYGNTLLKIQRELKLLRKKAFKHADTSDSSEDEMKEIGRTGSGIFITDTQWTVAKRAKSYTAMGINLLMSLFPMKTLLQSNLRGGQSRINKQDGGTGYKALNERVLDALYYTVHRHWKSSFNSAGLGMAINNKLTRLRSAEKKRIIDQADRQAQEQESHDEEGEMDPSA